jgi:hypothetical protein
MKNGTVWSHIFATGGNYGAGEICDGSQGLCAEDAAGLIRDWTHADRKDPSTARTVYEYVYGREATWVDMERWLAEEDKAGRVLAAEQADGG